jgi:hypothetical protein
MHCCPGWLHDWAVTGAEKNAKNKYDEISAETRNTIEANVALDFLVGVPVFFIAHHSSISKYLHLR